MILRNRKSLGRSTFLTFVDFKKAFDSVDRGLLMYKLLNLGISGNFYKAITNMYTNPVSRVILNSYETNYFPCPMGVKQGDSISATLFALFINDLALEIKNSQIGIELNDQLLINILMYADDIVLLASCEADMQDLLCLVEL